MLLYCITLSSSRENQRSAQEVARRISSAVAGESTQKSTYQVPICNDPTQNRSSLCVAVPSQDHAGTHSTLMQRFEVQSHLNLLHDSHIESLLRHNKFGRRPTHEK